MAEALARVRNELLSRKIELRRAGGTILTRLAVRMTSLSAPAYFAAVLCALVVGIAMNALILQRGRHPAPLFAPSRPASVPARSLSEKAGPARDSSPAVTAPARESAPAPMTAPQPPAAERRVEPKPPAAASADPIGAFLHQEKAEETASLLQTARRALVKLGYPVRLNSDDAEVRKAIHEFERSHNLPLTEDITPRLAKRIEEAARSAQR